MTAGTESTRRLIVLGSTGSVGVNTLDVVEHLRQQHGEPIQIVGLAARSRAARLIGQAERFGVTDLAIADPKQAGRIADALPDARLWVGPDAMEQLVESVPATDLCGAVVGQAALGATLAGIRKGLTIQLANKETLVAAGELVTSLLRRHGARLIPIDSEHSAIFQCLSAQADAAGGLIDRVKRIVLTASGGPFRTVDKKTMDRATVAEALRHPTWKMGPKISIDSATMMNKALEIVEAHWLFGLPAEKIEVIVHPQSVAHSFVEFQDHSILAQLGPPDMRTPIQYALTWPKRSPGCGRALDWSALRRLEFEPPDHEKFGGLKLAYHVVEAGQTAGAVFNAANEAAVAAFMDGRIRFGRIVELVSEALEAIALQPATDLRAVLEADRTARQFVQSRVQRSNVG